MNTTIEVPTTWSEITLAMYQDYMLFVKNISTLTDVEIKVRTVSIFTGQGIDELMEMSYTGLNMIYNALMKLIDNSQDVRLRPIVLIDGVKYGFHPTLSEMKMGEFGDLETLLEQPDGRLDFWANAHQILSILYRPVTKIRKRRFEWWRLSFGRKQLKYAIEPYTAKHIENADKMKGLDMETVNAASVFFYQLGSDILHVLNTSSTRQLSEMSKKYKVQTYLANINQRTGTEQC